ncbi:MAG: hypothetical protein WBQ53_17325 [Methylocystis sp.]
MLQRRDPIEGNQTRALVEAIKGFSGRGVPVSALINIYRRRVLRKKVGCAYGECQTGKANDLQCMMSMMKIHVCSYRIDSAQAKSTQKNRKFVATFGVVNAVPRRPVHNRFFTNLR